MGIKDVLTMLFERGNAMQTFWGFYITVAGALIAFFGSAQRSRLLATVLSGAFIAFALVNAGGMHSIAKQRHALYHIVTSPPSTPAGGGIWTDANVPHTAKDELLAASTPPDPRGVMIFHVLSDLAVLAAIWLLTLLPRELVRPQP